MATLYLYRDDYADSPRETEWSEKVVRFWYDERVRYADEDIADGQCMGIVAERLIVRRLLGIEALEMTYLLKAAHAKPFGHESPNLSELLTQGVFIAMALIPLSPLGRQGCPIMARLYCVSGLPNRYNVVLDGNEETTLQRFSWFLAGVPQAMLNKGVVGRSWLLAANLLSRIVERRDVKTARNLAKSYIVTGDVSGSAIRRVEMLRKPELAKQFANFKWIIPEENEMDIPKRKIEKPATLEEAYKLIETMQNTMTRDLCAIVNRDIDTQDDEWYQRVDRIRDLLAKGADPNAIVQGDCAWRVYRNKLDHFLNYEKSDEWAREQALLIDRTFSFYGAIPQFFFMLAHVGEKNMLEALSRSFDIDAIDYQCETALDFAEEANDVQAKELLIACGAKKRGRFLVNSNRFWTALTSFVNDQYLGRQEAEKMLMESLDKGLSPNDRFSLGTDGLVKRGSIIIPADHDPMEAWETYQWEEENFTRYEFETTRYESTIMLEALYIGNKPIVEKCLAIGISPDLEIKTKDGSILREKLIGGKVVEKNEDELIVLDTWRKRKPISEFIKSANGRNEFSDKGLAADVIKYFEGLKSQAKR